MLILSSSFPRCFLPARATDDRSYSVDASSGEVEEEDGVLVIRRIHVSMRLVAPEDAKEKVERVHAVYPMSCPLYRTLHNAIRLTSSYDLVAS